MSILNDLLDKVPIDLDKREGSPVYEFLSPVAMEYENFNIKLQYIAMQSHPSTATGEYLDRFGIERGIYRELPTSALVKAEITGVVVPVGSRFSGIGVDFINYVVAEKVGETTYHLLAEVISDVANSYIGDILPITVLNGLKTSEITEIIIPQRIEETDEEYRVRIQNEYVGGASDNNVTWYKNICANYDGIGNYKIFPLWAGVNTVKTSILNELNSLASAELMEEFQLFLDPNSEGLGNGKAPIGAIVTVDTATAKNISISADVTFNIGFSSAVGLKQELIDFLREISYNKEVVNYLAVGGVFLENESIKNVSNLVVNGVQVDVDLLVEEIPVLLNLTLNGVIVDD